MLGISFTFHNFWFFAFKVHNHVVVQRIHEREVACVANDN